MNQYIIVGKAFWELFQETADPWKRELARAKRQLSRLTSNNVNG